MNEPVLTPVVGVELTILAMSTNVVAASMAAFALFKSFVLSVSL